jgi:hypothetical protein
MWRTYSGSAAGERVSPASATLSPPDTAGKTHRASQKQCPSGRGTADRCQPIPLLLTIDRKVEYAPIESAIGDREMSMERDDSGRESEECYGQTASSSRG